jgi:nucleotide-binding universal stress UspA family protein
MKTIVVPVDFSDSSLKALKKALHIAQKMDGEIALLHVNKTHSFLPFMPGKPTETEDDIKKNFTELLKNVPSYAKVTHDVRTGKVPKEIIRYAEQKDAWLIIMGSHGASGKEENWMGSNAYRVVSGADCPVMTIRGSAEPRMELKKIVMPIDLTPTTRHKVPFTMELAKLYRSEVHVVAVCTDDSQEFVIKLTSYTAQVARFLGEHGVKTVTDFLKGDNITNMTIDYAKKVDADLISIMTEQESNVLNMFLGTFAHQMVNRSPIDILSIHPNLAVISDLSY